MNTGKFSIFDNRDFALKSVNIDKCDEFLVHSRAPSGFVRKGIVNRADLAGNME
jgi:hypothetical protein